MVRSIGLTLDNLSIGGWERTRTAKTLRAVDIFPFIAAYSSTERWGTPHSMGRTGGGTGSRRGLGCHRRA